MVARGKPSMSFWSVLDNALGAVDAETQHSRGSPRAAPTVRAETGKATIPRSSTLPVSQKATVPGSVAGTGGPASLGGSSGATRRQRVVEAAGPTAEKRGSSASRAGRSANGRSSKKRCVARSASHTVAKPVDEQAPPRLARSKTAAPVLQTPERPSAAAPSTAAGVSLPRQASRLKDDGAFEGCVVWFEASTARRLGKTRMKLFCNKVLPRKLAKVVDAFDDSVTHIVADKECSRADILGSAGRDAAPWTEFSGGLKICLPEWLSSAAARPAASMLWVDDRAQEESARAEKLQRRKADQAKRREIAAQAQGVYAGRVLHVPSVASTPTSTPSQHRASISSGDSSRAAPRAEFRSRSAPSLRITERALQAARRYAFYNARRETEEDVANSKRNANNRWIEYFEKKASLYQLLPLLGKADHHAKYKVRVYERAARALKFYPTTLTRRNVHLIKEKKVRILSGESIYKQLVDCVTKGRAPPIDGIERADFKATKQFMDIWGVGPVTAAQLWKSGYKSIDDLREAERRSPGTTGLHASQLNGLELYEDLQRRIPRAEVKEIEEVVLGVAERVYGPGLRGMACGSYRRGKATCGDVDVILTHVDGSVRGLETLVGMLKRIGFLTHDMVSPGDKYHRRRAPASSGDMNSYMGVCRVPRADWATVERLLHCGYYQKAGRPGPLGGAGWKPSRGGPRGEAGMSDCVLSMLTPDIIRNQIAPFIGGVHRRVDTLYFTGSGHYNRSMRHWVSKYLGHSLSDKGLVRVSRRWLKGKSESVKFQTGDLITAGSEEEIFELLHLPWKPPTERDIFEGKGVVESSDDEDSSSDGGAPTDAAGAGAGAGTA